MALTMTPSSFVQVANSGVLTENCLPELEYMIMSGEVMPWAQLAVWMNAAPKGHAWNFYGSTVFGNDSAVAGIMHALAPSSAGGKMSIIELA